MLHEASEGVSFIVAVFVSENRSSSLRSLTLGLFYP